jgi:hypothetical protein
MHSSTIILTTVGTYKRRSRNGKRVSNEPKSETNPPKSSLADDDLAEMWA